MRKSELTPENRFCCKEMQYHISFRCPEHDDPFACPDHIMVYSEQTDTFGIPVHDGGQSYIRIQYCPWCGQKL